MKVALVVGLLLSSVSIKANAQTDDMVSSNNSTFVDYVDENVYPMQMASVTRRSAIPPSRRAKWASPTLRQG